MVSQTAGSLLMSVFFWLALLASAVMYSAVALSPKLADWISVRQQFLSNAVRLKELEDEVDYLERVSAALKSDSEFAKRLVRANQDTGSRDSEFVPVSQDLLFGGGPRMKREVPQAVQPALANLTFHLASNHSHRNALLIAAACLTISAFTLLNDAGVGTIRAALRILAILFATTTARYRRPLAEPEESDPEAMLD
jgi:hypothetical protein